MVYRTPGYTLNMDDPDKQNEILNSFDQYIVMHVKLFMGNKKSSPQQGVADFEVDELTQRVRVKLWKALGKREIYNPQAYIKRIIHSEYVDMKRCQKEHLSLNSDDSNYQLQEQLLEETSGNDPSEIVEQEAEMTQSLQTAIELIIQLPPRQRLAVICTLRDRIDDIEQLEAMFRKYNINIEVLQCPTEKAERQVLQASLSIARRTLAKNLKKQT